MYQDSPQQQESSQPQSFYYAQQQPPLQQSAFQQQPAYYPQAQQPAPQSKIKGYIVTSLILLIVAGVFNVIGLIPVIGFFFGLLGLVCDVLAVIFLIVALAG